MTDSATNVGDGEAIRHVPEDMTVQARADVALAALQAELGRRGQWLPIDPPGAWTLRELLDANASGPRRYGYGTIREHVIGLHVRLPDGREIRSGGNVVKNVAGYDLCKLFIGARGRLGAITAAVFKLRPLPEVEQFVKCDIPTWEEAAQLLDGVIAAPVSPVVLDLVSPRSLVVGFAGTRAEVEWQIAVVGALGLVTPARLDYAQSLPRRVSVLPSRVVETVRSLGAEQFIARAGNGVIEYRGGAEPPITPPAPQGLVKRLEDAFR